MFFTCLTFRSQGFAVCFACCSHAAHRDLLCIFLISPTQSKLYFACFSQTPPKGIYCAFVCLASTTHRDLLCALPVSPTPPTGIYYTFCTFLPHHAQRVTVYFVSLHVSPTPSTGTYCVICMFLSRSLHGFTAYFVYFSYTSHRDLLCILY